MLMTLIAHLSFDPTSGTQSALNEIGLDRTTVTSQKEHYNENT